MLSREEAERQLKTYARPDEVQPGLGQRWALLRSGPLLSELTTWLTEHKGDRVRLGEQIDELPTGKRRQLFQAVIPVQADAVSHWWEWARQAPYQSGYGRRGFRSSQPRDSVDARMERLKGLVNILLRYPQPIEWHAQWATYTGLAPHGGPLFAAEIARGNAAVARSLTDQAAGRDPVGGMDTHVISGLLSAPDPRGWATIAQLLRAAGREEGLRQSILESADLAAPGALRLILSVVVDEGLTRFASAIRAVGVWWGENFEVRQDEQVRAHLAAWLPMLDRPPTGPELLQLPAHQAYLGLHARALHDARDALAIGGDVLRAANGPAFVEHRLAVIRVFAELYLPETAWLLAAALRDPDLRVVAAAIRPLVYTQHIAHQVRLPREVVEPVVRDLAKYGPEQTLQVGLLGVRGAEVGTHSVADALVTLLHPGIADVLEPVYPHTTVQGRSTRMRWLRQQPERHRSVLFEFLGDSSDDLRRQAASALSGVARISTEEARLLEGLLTRKAGSLRTTALDFLGRQEPAALAATVERLRAGDALQQRAAAELSGSSDSDTGGPSARVRAALDYLDVPARVRTPSVRPQVPSFAVTHPMVATNAQRVVDSLTAWLGEHGSQEVLQYGKTVLLSDLRRVGWVQPGGRTGLEELLDPWWGRIAPTLTLGGLELLLIDGFTPRGTAPWGAAVSARIIGGLRWPRLWEGSPLAASVIGVLARRELRSEWADPYLHAWAEAAAALDVRQLPAPVAVSRARGVSRPVVDPFRASPPDPRTELSVFGAAAAVSLAEQNRLTEDQWHRLWRLLRFVDEPEGARDLHTGPTIETVVTEYGRPDRVVTIVDQPYRRRPPGQLAVNAFLVGAATEGDVIDALIANPDHRQGSWANRQTWRELTGSHPAPWALDPRIRAVVTRVVDALIDIEVERGDLPTRYTDAVRGVQRVTGVRTLLRLLGALNSDSLVRSTWGSGRGEVLSDLLRRCMPGPGESDEHCVDSLRTAGLSEKRLIDLVVYAPQWAHHVEEVLGWPGLESAVWWLHAHTKDSSWSVSTEIRAEWDAAVSQRTPLTADELTDGATDVDWFGRVRSELGDSRFDRLLAVAKYTSGGSGHKRAELFAQALRGQVDEADSRARAGTKRHQDSVRALGLIPLPDGHERADVVLSRYEFLTGFVAGDRSSGSQRRASETLAVQVGMENLARSAGYQDPQRLVWAMEAHAVRDLAAGPVSATEGDLVVTLSLTEDGQPELDVRRGDKTLKSVPAASRKVPDIAALTGRVATLRKQRSRMRDSLEASCVRGDTFAAGEWAELFAHPILRPMLRELVVVSAEGLLGFADDPDHVIDADGVRVGLDGSPLRIAHPLDLLRDASWPDFQHRLFEARRTQPFKQVFRELYTPTESERGPEHTSRRYTGHQVQPRQAAGLFRARGWVADFETGFMKTYHDAGLTVWCSLLDGYGSPTEVEDSTVDTVWFVKDRSVLPLDEVPPRLFSETMRDLDLVVSVAHSGGVDPETSESAVELRRRLVEETALMLKILNVTTMDHHAEISGKLATYSVNLGSGVVHRRPGNAVCIVPVSAQHRGRVFLPFADDDPKTAEVISKVLLLARDDKIKDPSILAQLR